MSREEKKAKIRQENASVVPDNNPCVLQPDFTQTYCSFCGRHEQRSKCARCLVTYYCNSDCQHNHWPIHRRQCNYERPNISEKKKENLVIMNKVLRVFHTAEPEPNSRYDDVPNQLEILEDKSYHYNMDIVIKFKDNAIISDENQELLNTASSTDISEPKYFDMIINARNAYELEMPFLPHINDKGAVEFTLIARDEETPNQVGIIFLFQHGEEADHIRYERRYNKY